MSDEPKKPTTQPSMPAQPPTRALPAMSDRAMLEDLYRLNKQQTETLISLSANVANLNHNVDLLGGQQDTIVVRLGNVEKRVLDMEDRVTRNSTRSREPSAHDLSNDQRIAEEISARTALAEKVDKHTMQLDSIVTEVAAVRSETVAQTATLSVIAGAVTGVKSFIDENPKFVATVVGIVCWVGSQIYSYIQARGH